MWMVAWCLWQLLLPLLAEPAPEGAGQISEWQQDRSAAETLELEVDLRGDESAGEDFDIWSEETYLAADEFDDGTSEDMETERRLQDDALPAAFATSAAFEDDLLGPKIPREVHRRVGIMNDSPVPGYWIVQELKLYYGETCEQKTRVTTFATDVYSTGTHRETRDITFGAAAFDGAYHTAWHSDCRESLGGCTAREVSLGMTITTDKGYKEAVKVKDDFWLNVTRPAFEDITVKCIRIFQSDDPLHKCDDVALVNGFPVEQDWRYEVKNVLYSTSGGQWCQRPAAFGTLWRIDNLEYTLNKWALSELEFYEDQLCTMPLHGKPLSRGNERPTWYGENNAFDGDVRSFWQSRCDPLPGSIAWKLFKMSWPGEYIGCEPEQAYLGIDFSDTLTEVLCVRLYQKAPLDISDEEQLQSWSAGFSLKQWVADGWVMKEQFWDIKFPTAKIDPLYIPTLQTPFIGGAPGKWEDMRPISNSAWRLTNDDYIQSWAVLELEFYLSEVCDAGPAEEEEHRPLKGTPISMQGPKNRVRNWYAFDREPRNDQFWMSSCKLGLNGTCTPGESWLGQYYRDQDTQVKCFRILQSAYLSEQSAFVNLWVYANGEWVANMIHRDIGGGSWNRRPAPPWTMMRLRNNDPIPGQWRVAEFKVYKDPLCILDGTESNPLSSGFRLPVDGADKFADGLARTEWGADCSDSEGCPLVRKYWIGVEMHHKAQEAKEGNFFVRCFKLWQSELPHQQVSSLQIQVWNGEFYELSPLTETGSTQDFGGGVWSRPISTHMTRWRIMPIEEEDRQWRLLEIELYADSRCTERLPRTGVGAGGPEVLSSGYQALVTGFRRIEKGRLWSEAEQFSDGNLTSGLLLTHKPSMNRSAYAGVDFLSLAVFVRCVRLMQGSMPLEYVHSLKMEIWDGGVWKEGDPELSKVEVNFDGLGGAGWQRRPADPGSMWRLENGAVVPEGWALYEAEIYGTATCEDNLFSGEIIASGYAPPLEDHGHKKAFDGDTETAWHSQCAPVEDKHRPDGFKSTLTYKFKVGCEISDAWIGIDLGTKKRAANQVAKCVRIFQVGYEPMQSHTVLVSKWDGAKWVQQWSLGGLGGSAWDQRPAAANSMWRIHHISHKDTPCKGQLSRENTRPWGIADLKFYTDDNCEDEVTSKGVPICSGSIEHYTASVTDQPFFNVSRINDDDQLTTWAANCQTGPIGVDSKRTNCSRAWVGYDFLGEALDIRCMKVVQSRLESAKCCDAAASVELQRWNGWEWVEATWYRTPPQPAVVTQHNLREPTNLGARFVSLGKCPPLDTQKEMWNEIIEEKRARKDSDNCIVKLTGAITLLAEPLCIKHERCVASIGNSGACCPMGNLVESDNRCCCSFMEGEIIYHDEKRENDYRDLLNFEFATIFLSNYLPWLGLVWTLSFYVTALIMPEDMEKRVTAWVKKEKRSKGGRGGCRLFCRRLAALVLWPNLVWRTFLAESTTEIVKLVRWFILPEGDKPKPLQMWRSLLFLIISVFFSGMVPWLLLGCLFGELMIVAALQLCRIIRYFKSPFDPFDLRDMAIRERLSRIRVKKEDDTASAADVASGVVATLVFGLAYFGKFIFDVLIVRAQMLSLEQIPNIEANRVVELFPGILREFREPGMLLYNLLTYASQLVAFVLARLIGIPLCEGSCSLVGSVSLVMILYGASQWLNYDLFGLFVASRQVVKSTRPECQRLFAQAMILICMSASFAAIQVTMVLFTRALQFANPFQQATWVCPFDDTLALYIGRTLLSASSLIGLMFVFLCVNGHFFGQDYLVERVAKFLDIDLAALDPDGAGEGGGWFRLGVFGAALPTLAGIWWDPWNIDAFLVKERAHVYAMELKDPQPCQSCGAIHTDYELMMTATGRTISAAAQIVPYGAIVAKASEYLNDPPIVYIGSRLPCLRLTKVPREPASLKNPVNCVLVAIAEALAFVIEYGIPLLRRAVSVASYVYVLIGTFSLTEENLVEQGTHVIMAGCYLSFFKGACFRFLPSLFSYGLGGVYFLLHRGEGTTKTRTAVTRTITGQVLSGAVCSTAMAGAFLTSGWTAPLVAVLVGSLIGWAFSIITLLCNALLEGEDPEPDGPPNRNVAQIIFKIMFSVVSGSLAGLIVIYAGEVGLYSDDITDPFVFQQTLGARLNFRGTMGVTVILLGAQFVTLRVVLVENLSWQVRSAKITPHPEYDWRDSPTWVVLRTENALPGLVGIPVATLASVLIGDICGAVLGPQAFVIQACRMGSGAVIANLVSLTVHQLMDHPPQLIGFAVGIVLAVFLTPWNLVFGGLLAVIAGTATGSLLEEFLIRRTMSKERERRLEQNEDAAMFFDHKRAELEAGWDVMEDKEEKAALPPLPTRDEKLSMYLEVALAGESATEYAEEWQRLRAEAEKELASPSGTPGSSRFQTEQMVEEQEEEPPPLVDSAKEELQDGAAEEGIRSLENIPQLELNAGLRPAALDMQAIANGSLRSAASAEESTARGDEAAPPAQPALLTVPARSTSASSLRPATAGSRPGTATSARQVSIAQEKQVETKEYVVDQAAESQLALVEEETSLALAIPASESSLPPETDSRALALRTSAAMELWEPQKPEVTDLEDGFNFGGAEPLAPQDEEHAAASVRSSARSAAQSQSRASERRRKPGNLGVPGYDPMPDAVSPGLQSGEQRQPQLWSRVHGKRQPPPKPKSLKEHFASQLSPQSQASDSKGRSLSRGRAPR
eukprot:TRINITY_DN15489_c0_g1_i1.p1 TRINITY_DN15489_c0_g1~~TRINITY_DN15489_c0_g1_i1.p1  ORF type:complete len:2718 (-),score=458.01 TRINITY_DN15489_c0_g1_i1:101-8230(-)